MANASDTNEIACRSHLPSRDGRLDLMENDHDLIAAMLNPDASSAFNLGTHCRNM